MIKKQDKSIARERRHVSIRKKLEGTIERPRLSIFRSSTNIYAQVINDESGETIVCASTIEKAIKDKIKAGGNIEAAKTVGKLVAERALKKGIKQVVFDRGGFLYHGRVKELAEAARAAGLEF